VSSPIFINYRRQDSAGHAAQLAERLQGDYDEDAVFFDQSTIKSGEAFPRALKAAVDESQIVIALIGRNWLKCKTDDEKRRRLDCKKDWVREELRRAFLLRKDGQNRLIIPVLVEGASMPKESDLPTPLKPLYNCNALVMPGIGRIWREAYCALLKRIDEKLGMLPQDRARDWVYDAIATPLEDLSDNQRRDVAFELSKLDNGGATAAYSARALAKRFYKIGPLALESLRRALPFNHLLRPVLEHIKDYWVNNEAATDLAETWLADEPCRTAIVRGAEAEFTPKCVVQKATNAMTPWRVKPIVSGTSQPLPSKLISDIHDWLRTVFADRLRRQGLPDREEEQVTAFLEERLAEKARMGHPLAVQLDEIGAADEPLIRSIQNVFPHLRLLILVRGDDGVRDLQQKYFEDFEQKSTTLVVPESKPGDEHAAAEAYYKVAEEFPLP